MVSHTGNGGTGAGRFRRDAISLLALIRPLVLVLGTLFLVLLLGLALGRLALFLPLAFVLTGLFRHRLLHGADGPV